MELVIANKWDEQLRSCYQIDVEFMFGDCDGEEHLFFEFSEDKYNNPEFKEKVHDFIKSIQSCIKLDDIGRGGFDSSIEASKWYALGKDRYSSKIYGTTYQWSRFCENAYYAAEYDNLDEDLLKELSKFDQEEDTFIYVIPTYDDGWYGSYQYIQIFYYDSDGYKYDVDIIDDEENRSTNNSR